MNGADYLVVFDFGQQHFAAWKEVLPAILGIPVGVVVWWLFDTLIARVVGAAMILGALFGVVYAYTSSLATFERYDRAYRAGEFEVVEGPVEYFDADFPDGKTPQKFSVGGRRFTTWWRLDAPAYANTIGARGPNLAGRCVRVAFIDTDTILWLGIKTGRRAQSGCSD